jgi:chemotaxis protein methyltransferase CheR
MTQLALSERTFKRISTLMYESIGLVLAESKRSLVTSRLGPRLHRLGLDNYDEYLALIESDAGAAEFQMAVDLLTTNETYFFREPQHFDLLERHVVSQRGREPLAVWSAASSFGDEAYSIAILLSDLQKKGQCHPDWTVLGTDISHRVLVSAKEAVFPTDRFRHVSPERMRNYCLRGEGSSVGQVMLQRKIRDRVQFGQLNLCRPFPNLGMFDVIFLRNVLIYFDTDTRKTVIQNVLECLNPGGLFFVGTAEGRIQGMEKLTPLITGAFRKPL